MKNTTRINTKNKYKLLQENRKEILKQSYYLYFANAIVSAILVGFLKPNISTRDRLFQVLISTIILSLVFGIISYGLNRIKSISRFDWLVFVLAIGMYVLSVVFSPIQKILAPIIIYPALLLLVFSTMSRLKVVLFIGFHFIVVTGFFIIDPEFKVTITAHNYATIFTIGLIITVIMIRLVKLFDTYQKNISDDYLELDDKNIELQALNEEYYATQEELAEKYKEIIELNNRNEHLAYYDTLTDLKNRNGFIRYIKSIIKSQDQENYIIFMDLERFKDINSVYGYRIGDAVLKQLCKRIEKLPYSIKESARLGGDLFAIVVDKAIQWEVLLPSLAKLNEDVVAEGFTIAIHLNMGIVDFIDTDLSSDMILQQADVALNKAKETQDKAYYVYGNRLSDEITRRVMMTQALEEAIINNKIVAVFQPIVRTIDKEIVSFEALARWEDERFGMVSPGEFIQLAEKTQIIQGITDTMLHQACDFIKNSNKKLTVSVNISGQELRKGDLSERLISIVDQHKIDHTCIAFEVTETGLIDRFDVAVDHLVYLREKGFAIYLDDFGIGYSSLNYLEQLPIDLLKIDRSFVSEIHISEKKMQMVQMMKHLAADLNIETVAEGVENIEEYNYLKEYGIDRIQGFYFYKPMTKEEIMTKGLL